jgi:hypothetical protein
VELHLKVDHHIDCEWRFPSNQAPIQTIGQKSQVLSMTMRGILTYTQIRPQFFCHDLVAKKPERQMMETHSHGATPSELRMAYWLEKPSIKWLFHGLFHGFLMISGSPYFRKPPKPPETPRCKGKPYSCCSNASCSKSFDLWGSPGPKTSEGGLHLHRLPNNGI